MKNRTLLFGEGLFETFRVYKGGKVAFLEDHLDRMADGCRFFAFPFSREKAVEELKNTLDQIPSDTEARLRLNLTCHGDQGVEETAFQTNWEPLHDTNSWDHSGVRLAKASFQRFSKSPLVRFKTTSYLENIFVFRWARGQGFFDAFFTNERDEITEGSICNIFFLSNGQIITPPTDAGLLPGVTRRQVIKVIQMLGLSVAESTVTLDDLREFDGAFVTNSVVEILPVTTLGDINYEIPDMIEALRDGYRRRVEDCLYPA